LACSSVDWLRAPSVVNADVVPWCETCDRFYNPNTLLADGTCPTCGRLVEGPERAAVTEEPESSGAPWHFKLLVAATAIYLGYRLFQGVLWLAQQL
jgi:predicted RNA-binding Zn-ribbon protein involved in translation (DUF1610 family)